MFSNFNDDEEREKDDFFDKKNVDNSDSEYEVEEDSIRTVFGSKKKEIEVDEDERSPQSDSTYEVKSQLIEEETDNLAPINVSKEMRTSFLEYAMSVIVSRALPDARDGLKPVHRRILYGMTELGLFYNAQYKKSARVVGDVLGKYHPHGDSSVYEAMVRMAQDFSLRYPLIDGHGNFGSIDGDSAAAMRYTEARMSRIASSMVEGLKKDTVDFIPNYDGSEEEPSVLPSRIPNLLISGATGIAVGMATTIPPHNLTETIDAVVALARNSEITIEELMQHIKGPDFPTGAEILGTSGIITAYETGRGAIVLRSKSHIETLKSGKSRIIITEIPYEVKKPAVIEKIALLSKEKRIEGISEIRDETSRKGIRVVIDLKKNVIPEVILNKVLKLTNLQVNYNFNMIALVKGEPKLLNLKQALDVYLKHQIDVVTRRTKFDLERAQDRAHILEGLIIAVSNIDEVIRLIRSSTNDNDAQSKLMASFKLSEIQAKAIIDMRLGRLTSLAIEKTQDELNALKQEIAGYENILNSHEKLIDLIVSELEEIKARFGDERRTIINTSDYGIIKDEDLIPNKNIAITLSKNGYVKRTPLTDFRSQKRGGVGVYTHKTYADDDVDSILTTHTHTDILVFTSSAKVYKIRAHQIPELSRQAKGVPFINFINIDKKEKVVSLLSVEEYFEGTYLLTITKNGIAKKTSIEAYKRIQSNGKFALSLKEDDELFKVITIDDEDSVIIGANNGKVVHFDSKEIRPMGRTASGVIAMKLDKKERVVGVGKSSEGKYVLSIGDKGFGKKTELESYRLSHRNVKGVISLNVKKAGKLNYVGIVKGYEEAIFLTNEGIAIRTELNQVSETSRGTKGVKLITLKDKDYIASIAIINTEKIDEEIEKSLELEVSSGPVLDLENNNYGIQEEIEDKQDEDQETDL
ncbi:DNA gyrase subunit A [[Mycoplasma] mobile]|uniref:DNA gyrase subunit A n=1 Tax=Mycoplasma mobile (strain ATCC 43663 / 163K / NCTC 11711) TaxID=267748 RepID=Q6KHF0_MYCM1|nr:DNA gyrase subunit A [[Mycoplasma] mobile]AAT27980.1 DNA gyrase subunit A [Mycoplasma mobile 163K]